MSKTPSEKPFAVLYGGAVGLSLFAELLSQSPSTRFFTGNEQTLKRLVDQGAIRFRGLTNNPVVVPREQIYSDIAACVMDASIIFCAAPAYMHSEMIEKIAPVLQAGQTIVLMPSRVFGGLEVQTEIARNRPDLAKKVHIVELQTVLYATRTAADGTVLMMGRKKQVTCSFLSPSAPDAVTSTLFALIPELTLAEDGYLGTSLNTVGPTLHTIPMVMNAQKIATHVEPLRFYQDLISPEIAEQCMELDQERLTLTRKLGVSGFSILDWIRSTYGVQETNLKPALDKISAYASVPAPRTIEHRYLLEDVPYGLVPFASLGEALGISMPVTRETIRSASELLGHNFWDEGRRVENLGTDLLDLIGHVLNKG